MSIKYCYGEIDETMAKSLLFISEYIYWLLCVGEELSCLRIVAKKFALNQN